MAYNRTTHRDHEHQLQTACVRWFRYQYPQHALLLFAVPNGGRRDPTTGARLKAEGVVAGVADLILLIPNARAHALMIELKTLKGRQQTTQRNWQQAVTTAGYQYSLVRTFEQFQNLITDYLQQ